MNKNYTIFTGLSILVFLLFIADISFGSVRIPFIHVFNYLTGGTISEQHRVILEIFRVPKTITALLAGMGLSIAGLLMQTLFRNPLAGPYVLGISSGASLGAAMVILGFSVFPAMQLNASVENWMGIVGSWAGAAFVLILIMIVSYRIRDIMTILILGIMFGSATSALVTILQYFSPESEVKTFVLWTMGSFGGVTGSQLWIFGPVIFAGLVLSLFITKPLNALMLGERYAFSLGVNIKTTRYLIFLATSLLAGTITAFCGPIGFIGIAVPHISRMIFKTGDHKMLTPGTIFLGGIIMLISDLVSKLPGSDKTLPINSVTALIGIPVIIWVIIRNKRMG